MKKMSLLKRAQLLQSISLVCVILMIVSLVRISAVLPGVSKEADQKKKAARNASYEKEYVRGSILDRNGNVLAFSDKAGGTRTYTAPRSFAGVIGYWSKIYGTYGLEDTFNDELVHSSSLTENKRGTDISLTLDLDLQKKAYKAIRKMEASLVVLDVKTGQILALASSPSYDAGRLEEDWDIINATEGALLANAYKNPVVPGSVFKLVTSTEILEAGIEDEEVDDQGSYKVNGQTIRNYNGKAYGRISFEDAFIKSSNVYFMDRAVKLGGESLEATAKRFLLGQDIPLDFTMLRSSFSLGSGEDNVLASTAFGQGETMLTPLHMAMITQSVANDGEMLEPYMILKKTNGKGKDTYTGQTRLLGRTMSEMTAYRLKDVMTKAGEAYELSLIGEKEYRIAAKTGTAQRGDGTNNAWMVSFAPADDPRYVVVACRLKTDKIGKSMAPVIEELYSWLLRQ